MEGVKEILRTIAGYRATAEKAGLVFRQWESREGWFCQYGENGTVESGLHQFLTDLEGRPIERHRGTTPGCFWSDWEAL